MDNLSCMHYILLLKLFDIVLNIFIIFFNMDTPSNLDQNHHIQKYTNNYLKNKSMSATTIKYFFLIFFYREFKRGYMEKSQRGGQFSPVANTTGTNTNWLSWIQPALFPLGCKQ